MNQKDYYKENNVKESAPKLVENDININLGSEDYDKLISKIKNYSSYLISKDREKNVSMSQIRNIFSVVKKIYLKSKLKEPNSNISEEVKAELQNLRIKLAYISGRFSNNKYRKFLSELELLIENIKTNSHIKKFYYIIEAFVAYMKFYENTKSYKNNRR